MVVPQYTTKTLITVESKQRVESINSFNSSVIKNIFMIKIWGKLLK